MGAGQSGGVEIGGSSMGYQVLRVYPNSPGSQAGLKAYFDFIVAIENTRFDKESGSLREILKARVDQRLKMVVYNTRSKTVREVDIVPTTSWGGSGLLGVSIKHSSFDRADERVWHVIEVDPGSPAHQAGFKANEDYVIGSDSILQENDDLYNLIEAHEGKALKLFVYNVKTDNCREVICYPNSKWGGRGYLGCEFGHGLLHRIPYASNQNGLSAGDSRGTPVVSAQQPQQQPTNNLYAFQNQTTQQPLQRSAVQPGYQLFQQALFDKNQLQHAQQQKLVDKEVTQLSQVPQTFAQLANAQYQAQQQERQYQQAQQQQQHQQQQQQQIFNYNQSVPPGNLPLSQATGHQHYQPAQLSPSFNQQPQYQQQQAGQYNLAQSDNEAQSQSASSTAIVQAQPSALPPPQQPQQEQPNPHQLLPAPYQYFASQPDQHQQHGHQLNQEPSMQQMPAQALLPPPSMYIQHQHQQPAALTLQSASGQQQQAPLLPPPQQPQQPPQPPSQHRQV